MTSAEVSADPALQALIDGFPEPEYRHLRQYAEAASMNHEDEASDELQIFITQVSGWDVRKRRQAAVRIADVAETFGAGAGSNAMPSRLWNELVHPILMEWAETDDIALPHRLLALLDWPSYVHLRRALELDPEDEAVAQRLAATLIRDVRFSMSERGEIDLAKLQEAELLVASLQDEEARQSLEAGLDDVRQRVSGRGGPQRPPNPAT